MNKDLYKGLEDITYTDEEIRRHTQLVKIGAKHKGKIVSTEQRAKLSAANKGKTLSAEHRAKIGAKHKGKPKSAEHRAKTGAAHSKPMMTPNGPFTSVTAVALAAEVHKTTIFRWMKKWPDQYYHISHEDYQKLLDKS